MRPITLAQEDAYSGVGKGDLQDGLPLSLQGVRVLFSARIVRVEKVRTGQPPLGLRAQVKVIGAVPEAAQAHRVIERLGGGAKIGNYLAGPELAAPLEADLDGLHGAK